MDVQPGITIRVLENFLRPYVEHRPSTWVDQLPLAAFVANNAVNVSTRYTPFYLSQGGHPAIPSSLLVGGLPKVSNQAMEEDWSG